MHARVFAACLLIWSNLISTQFSPTSTWQSCSSSVNCTSTPYSHFWCLKYFLYTWIFHYCQLHVSKMYWLFLLTTLLCWILHLYVDKPSGHTGGTHICHVPCETSVLLKWHYKGPIPITVYFSSHTAKWIQMTEARIFLLSDILEFPIVVRNY